MEEIKKEEVLDSEDKAVLLEQTETTNPDIPEDETEHERKEREAKEKEESRLNKPITYKFLLLYAVVPSGNDFGIYGWFDNY